MAEAANQVAVDITGNVLPFKRAVDGGVRALDSFGDAADRAKKKTKDLADATREQEKRMRDSERAAQDLGRTIGLGLAAAAAGSILLFNRANNLVETMSNLATGTGLSATAFSTWAYAAKQDQISAQQLSDAFVHLNKNLAEAASGRGDGGRIFKAMGIDIRDANKNLKTLDQILAEASGKLSGYADGWQRSALATQLLGQSGDRLLPLLSRGPAGIKAMRDEAEKLGVAITPEQVARVEQYQRELAKIKAQFDAMVISLAQGVLPKFSEWLQQMNEGIRIAGSFRDAFRIFSGINPFKDAGANVKDLTKELDDLTAARERYLKSSVNADVRSLDVAIDTLKKQIEFSKFMQRQEIAKGNGPANYDARDYKANQAPTTKPAPIVAKGGKEFPMTPGIRADIEAAEQMKKLREEYMERRYREEIQFGETMNALNESNIEKRLQAEVQFGETMNSLREANIEKNLAEEVAAGEQMNELFDRYKEAKFAADEFTRSIENETAAAHGNARARQRIQDGLQLEHMGLKKNSLAWDEYMERIEQARERQERAAQSWDIGLSRALDDYHDKVTDVASQTERLWSGTFDRLEEASADWVFKGKLDISELGEWYGRELVKMLVRKQTLGPIMDWFNNSDLGNALGSGLGSLFGFKNAPSGTATADFGYYSAPTKHTGGIVGGDGGGSRVVSMSAFKGARRMRGGGIAGDEVATILRKREGVFTPEQMKALAPAGAAAPQAVRVEISNQGTPQQVQSATTAFDAEGMIVRIVLQDLKSGGRIAQGIQGAYNLRRGGS